MLALKRLPILAINVSYISCARLNHPILICSTPLTIHAGAYLGNVLYHRSKEGTREAYDLGLELVERLVFIGSKDESLDLADVIHGLVECYKAM